MTLQTTDPTATDPLGTGGLPTDGPITVPNLLGMALICCGAVLLLNKQEA